MYRRFEKGADWIRQNLTKVPERGWGPLFGYSRCLPEAGGKYEHDFEAPPIIPSSAESIPDLQHRTGSIPSAEGSYNPWNTNDERNLGGGDKGTEGNIAEQTSVRGMVDAYCQMHKSTDSSLGENSRLLWIDERGHGSTNLDKQKYCKRYQGPLTARELYKILKRPRFRNEPTNVVNDKDSNTERRLIYITGLDPSTIEALIATASRSHSLALHRFLYSTYTRICPFIYEEKGNGGSPLLVLEFNEQRRTRLPTLTRGEQTTTKKCVNHGSQAFIYSQNRTSEKGNLLSKHLRGDRLENTTKLDRGLRLNHLCEYSEEHNPEVEFIKEVDGTSTYSIINQGISTSQEVLTQSNMEPGCVWNPLVMIQSLTIEQGETIIAALIEEVDSRLYEEGGANNLYRPVDEHDDKELLLQASDDWKLVEEHGELYMILGNEICDYGDKKNTRSQHLTPCRPQPGFRDNRTKRIARGVAHRATAFLNIYDIHASSAFIHSPKALAGLGMGSGFLMSASFMWLTKRMGDYHPSEFLNWITTAAIRNVPSLRWKSLERIPDGVIFGSFVTATVVFTGATFAWATNCAQTPEVKWLGWAIVAMSLVLWIIMGVNPEELVLVCLPLSVALGILSSCFFGKPKTPACWDEKDLISVV